MFINKDHIIPSPGIFTKKAVIPTEKCIEIAKQMEMDKGYSSRLGLIKYATVNFKNSEKVYKKLLADI